MQELADMVEKDDHIYLWKDKIKEMREIETPRKMFWDRSKSNIRILKAS